MDEEGQEEEKEKDPENEEGEGKRFEIIKIRNGNG